MEAERGEEQKHNSKEHSCKNCGKSFPIKSRLVIHERVHTGEKPYKCDICENTFSVSSSLVEHKRIHTGEKPYECEICEKTFTQSSGLVQHRRIHTGEKPFECDICEKAFVEKSKLVVHQRVHTGAKPFSCDICQKSFAERSSLSKHNKSAAHLMNKESIDKDSSFQNNFVDYSASSKIEDSKEEINQEESVNDPLSCTPDNNESSNNGNRVYNITEKGINTSKRSFKPYQCDVCEKIFNQKHYLKSHKLIHSGHKAYPCNICGKDFSRKDSLTRHKRIHSTSQSIIEPEISSINFVVDCVKAEDIKEEINEEESVDDPLFIQVEETKGDRDNIVEVKEEVIDDDSLCVQELHNSGDGANNIVVDDIDIVEHKIEIDIIN